MTYHWGFFTVHLVDTVVLWELSDHMTEQSFKRIFSICSILWQNIKKQKMKWIEMKYMKPDTKRPRLSLQSTLQSHLVAKTTVCFLFPEAELRGEPLSMKTSTILFQFSMLYAPSLYLQAPILVTTSLNSNLYSSLTYLFSFCCSWLYVHFCSSTLRKTGDKLHKCGLTLGQ